MPRSGLVEYEVWIAFKQTYREIIYFFSLVSDVPDSVQGVVEIPPFELPRGLCPAWFP